MPRAPQLRSIQPRRFSGERGSLLITAMLLASVIALGIAGYLNLSRNSLKLAQRSFFANDAGNLAEAGLEEAIYCFNLMGSGATVATAWGGWTLSGANAMRTLPPFNRDQNAVGIVKVFVHGYNGTDSNPYVIAQATITPFDGSAPMVKVQQFILKRNTGFTINGVVGLNGLTVKGSSIFDSFNSNPAGNPSGPWAAYTSAGARANTTVIVPAGTASLGNGAIVIYGNLLLGAGVTAPKASQVTGVIQPNFQGAFKMPVYPTAASVSQSYNLGATLPATLPASGHLPASDGRYYYFCNGAVIGTVTIPAGRNVTIVGTNTRLTSGLTLQGDAACAIYIDGSVTCTGTVNNGSWAGALQIFTTTTADCSIGNNGQIVACLYAPNAALTASGGGNSGMLVGYFVARTVATSGHMDFHYDEALMPFTPGNPWQLTKWTELQSSADLAQLAALTNNFLP